MKENTKEICKQFKMLNDLKGKITNAKTRRSKAKNLINL